MRIKAKVHGLKVNQDGTLTIDLEQKVLLEDSEMGEVSKWVPCELTPVFTVSNEDEDVDPIQVISSKGIQTKTN